MHPNHVNLEMGSVDPDAMHSDANWVTEFADSEISGNVELELSWRAAMRLADALLEIAATESAASGGDSTCDECSSQFTSSDATMSSLYPECSHSLYGKPNCVHSFHEGRCTRCSWDGSASRFGKVFRCIRRLGVSHGSRVEPGLTPKRRMGFCAMNYRNLLIKLRCVDQGNTDWRAANGCVGVNSMVTTPAERNVRKSAPVTRVDRFWFAAFFATGASIGVFITVRMIDHGISIGFSLFAGAIAGGYGAWFLGCVIMGISFVFK